MSLPCLSRACALLLAAACTSASAVEPSDCGQPLPVGEAVAALPDPLLRRDGERIPLPEGWDCQRQTLAATAQAYLYGPRGPAPDRVEGRLEAGHLLAVVHQAGRTATLRAQLELPPGPGPHPVVIVLGGGIDAALLSAAGVARLDFDPTQAGAETGQGRRKQGAFFELLGAPVRESGTLMAWAWGVSRLIDAIEAEGGGLLRADAIGVAGCSRYGKGALAAGAFDTRVALTLPMESGAGGVPLWRGAGEGAQPAHSAFGEQPWLGDGFGVFAAVPGRLPLDQHTVLALVVPRGLLVLDNPHIAWLAAPQGKASVLAAAEVYRALGAPEAIGYHPALADGTHCAWRPEWDAPARAAIARHLAGRPAAGLPAGDASRTPPTGH